MSLGYTQTALKLRLTTALGADKLIVGSVDGEEGLSTLFHYTVHAFSEDPGLDFAAIVDTRATLHLSLASGTERYLNGLVSRFVQAGSDGRLTAYRLELRPWLWLLSLASDCRIYQQQSVQEIVGALFQELGFVENTDFRWELKSTYAKRDYCVQYKETALNFVCRLLEDEGIFYFFDHQDGKHVLVLGDDADAHPACPGLTAAHVQKSQVEAPEEDGILRCTFEESVVPKSFALGDYDYLKPKTSLQVKAEGKTGKMALYDYHGGYLLKDPGEARANRRLQGREWSGRTLRGEGYCRAFAAGFKFTLEEHPREAVNGDYVLEWLSLHAEQTRYHNSFRAFPAAVPYRPPLVAERPRVTGSETAVVTGKSGDEIFADQHGRIKVHFHWDRKGALDEKSSCWVRVAQPWAGTGWGALVLPRVGQEVVVQYLDGDPDRPLVTGAVYNGDHAPPYDPSSAPETSTLKSNSSKGGGGFNEIRLIDKKDSEELFLHAQKKMTVTVLHDRIKTVGNDETITVKKNRTTTIQEEHEKLTVAKGNRTVLVQKGNETHEVKGTRGLKVTGAETHENEADFTHKVKGNVLLQIKGNLTIDVTGSVTIKTQQSMAVKAAMAIKHEAGTDILNKATMGIKNEALSIASKASTSLKSEGLTVESKASVSLKNEAGVMLSVKGGAMAKCEGGGMLMLKGGMVKIN